MELQFLHDSLELIHAAIKPANILVRCAGDSICDVNLADLGSCVSIYAAERKSVIDNGGV